MASRDEAALRRPTPAASPTPAAGAPTQPPAARGGFGSTDLLLMLMALIWGINFSVIKYGTRGLDPLAYNGMRVAIAAVALSLIAAAARATRPAWRDVRALLLLGLLGNGVYQLLFIMGVALTRAGTAAIVLGASPALIALAGRLIKAERITRRQAGGIALSIAGVALVVAGDFRAMGEGSNLRGALFVLAGSSCWAVYTVLLRPYTHTVGGLQLSAFTLVGGALPLVLLAIPAMRRTDWTAVSGGTWAAVLYSGLGALVVAYLLWYRGVKVLGPTRTAMYSNLQPVIALLVAWGTLGEVPTGWQAAGAAAIMSGILLTRR